MSLVSWTSWNANQIEGTEEWKRFCQRYEVEDPNWVIYSTLWENKTNWQSDFAIKSLLINFLHWQDLLWVRLISKDWKNAVMKHENWDLRPREVNLTQIKPLVYHKNLWEAPLTGSSKKSWADMMEEDSDYESDKS